MNRRQPPGIWATNHLANPILRQLLRGPAGHRLSRRLALIRYPGRRTGRMYELPVQFARNGNRIWICLAHPSTRPGGATCAVGPTWTWFWRDTPPTAMPQ